MEIKDILVCPVCKAFLYKEEKSYFCEGTKKHCFDISSSGHANLYPGKATGGDDKKAVRSRTDFLTLGYYKPISDKICEIIKSLPKNEFVVDAGCGEGYYSNNMAREIGAQVLGFDLSKEAIIAASKSAKRQGLDNARFFVGGIYDLPVCDHGTDVVTNIFAPCSEIEFSRILKDSGTLIIVASGETHLYGLKKAIYDNVYTNDERADIPRNMRLVEKHNVSYSIQLDDANAIQNLFSMTPYSYRTSEKDYQKLLSLTSLETEIDVDIMVYQKGEKIQ